jgi:multidrug resistance efflux pump
MKEGLNLLPSVAKFQASKIKLKKQIRMGMLVFLSFWILLILAIFIQLWFNNYSLKTTKNKYAVYRRYKISSGG